MLLLRQTPNLLLHTSILFHLTLSIYFVFALYYISYAGVTRSMQAILLANATSSVVGVTSYKTLTLKECMQNYRNDLCAITLYAIQQQPTAVHMQVISHFIGQLHSSLHELPYPVEHVTNTKNMLIAPSWESQLKNGTSGY